MCGIAGAVGPGSALLAREMVATLQHRGPDSKGICIRPNAAMGTARLSIVDHLSGAQPIYNEAGDIALCFNGEIYNHRELRAALIRKGHVFRSETDTEVIVHLYEDHGERCVEYLHGMFAFAIIDGDKLLLARDRLGIKPLHYAFIPQASRFAFASEIKAILKCPEYTPRIDTTALADATLFGHPIGSASYFEGIRCVPPGHTMTIAIHGAPIPHTPKRYHRVSSAPSNLSLDDAQSTLDTELSSAVSSHLAADVDVGLTLSGGLDSTVLALICREHRESPLITFTVADDPLHPDIGQAASVAEMIGAEHVPVIAPFSDYLAAIPDCIVAEESPSSLHGLPFFLLCRTIASRVKACLHGEGADELFGGYRDYLDRESRTSNLARRLRFVQRNALRPSGEAIAIVERISATRSFDEYLRCIFDVNLADPLERHHLDPVDKCAMAASVEMRVPYLDDSVVEVVTALPDSFRVRADLGIRKYLLRRLCLERFGMATADIVLREKLGVPSAGVHHLQRFIEICERDLPDSYLTDHEFGQYFESKYRLLLFDLFYQIFVVHRGDADTIGGVSEFIASRANKCTSSVTLAQGAEN